MKNALTNILDLNNIPSIITNTNSYAGEKFAEFFLATIRNTNTRMAYMRAIKSFLHFMEARSVHSLLQIRPIMVAAYIEQHPGSKPTINQHLAAIRKLFDYLVINHVIDSNPSSSVKGEKHIVKVGKTPVLQADAMRHFLDSIDISTKLGIRDRALIGVMVFSFARISAVINMQSMDYYMEGKRSFFRFNEKGGKDHHVVPVHHTVEDYLDAYIETWGIPYEKKTWLWLTKNNNQLQRKEAWAMVKRRAKTAGLPANICNHTFRATGITNYLENNGTLENAQKIAAHSSNQSTKLYDRRGNKLSLDEIEKIQI